MYKVDDKNTTVLRGTKNAKAPQPAGLFIESVSLSDPDFPKTWTPNIEFVDAKLYRAHQVAASYDKSTALKTGKEDKYWAERTSKLLEGKWDSKTSQKSDSTKEGYGPAVGKKVKELLTTRVLPTITKNVKQKVAKLGIVSPNDCTRFATAMKNLLASFNFHSQVQQYAEVSAVAARSLPNLGIGDMIVLTYPHGGRHGITCVAVDSARQEFVCLEAHASKFLDKPEFHHYGSMAALIDKYFNQQQKIHPKSTVRRIPAKVGPGMEEPGCSVKSLKANAKRLSTLAKGKSHYELWTHIASAGALPCLFDPR